MGLFSSSKKITVGTSVSRAIEDNLLPDSVKTGTLRGLLQEEGTQLVENILEELTGSIGPRAERMYAYGQKTYMFGLPKSTLVDNTSGEDVVCGVLSQLVGQGVHMDYFYFGPENFQHAVWTKLYNLYGYNFLTNELKTLSAQKGTEVYLWDFQIILKAGSSAEYNPSALYQWGGAATSGFAPGRRASIERLPRPHTPICFNPATTEDHAVITYRWGASTETLTLSLAYVDPLQDFFQAKYSWNTPESGIVGEPYSNTSFWSYQEGSGIYPEIDAIHSTEFDDLGSFFPWAYFRYNKTDCLGNPTSQEYKQSKKLLGFLKMDFEQIAEAIKKNPDIGDVESALMMMAVPVTSTNTTDLRYLFDFFRKMYLKTGGTPIQSLYAGDSPLVMSFGAPTSIGMIIEDARFKMSLALEGLNRRVVAGSIGAVGTYAMTQSEEEVAYLSTNYDQESGQSSNLMSYFNTACYAYRKQLTPTLYEEIRVVGPNVMYRVSGSYMATATAADKNLLIPIDHSITEAYTIPDRETLYARSMHYVINSKIITKVKWYQSGFFKFVVLVIAVVISVLSFNPGPLMAAVAAGGTTLALFVANMLLEMVLFTLAMKLFVKLVGVKFAALVAVIAACYALGTGVLNGGSLEGVPWGEDLLQLSSGIAKEANSSLQEDLLGIKSDFEDLTALEKEQGALLDKANDLLTNQNILSPFVIFGESPTDYYERTVHSGNIGVLGLDAVTRFCDVALTLPKISQTLGDSVNTDAFAFNNLG